jgi:diadenosine tetraphosphate (Ap4A) HIT family hydrolase
VSPVACAFCERVIPDRTAHLAATEYSIAFLDAFPSAPGHTLLVPRRHVALLSELTEEEHADLFALLRTIVTGHAGNAPARTIGINDGPLAGQTVPHLHLHVVPRSEGDVADPRGGVRWVLPATAAYWDRRT